MQKVQSYLYPNRVILLADLAGFTVENRIVYARKVKLYNGVDNVIEFDIQNADQKRIDLTTLGNLSLNLMDAAGNSLPNSPYTCTAYTSATATNATVVATMGQSTTTTITIPTTNITGTFGVGFQLAGSAISGPVLVSGVSSDVDSATTTLTVTFPNQTVASATGVSLSCVIKGIAKVIIPSADLEDITDQYLNYSVTAVDTFGNDIVLYCDSQFGAVGTMEVVGSAMPTFRDDRVYDEFSGEINFMGNVINHTSAIPCKFYEAVPVTTMSFDIYLSGFVGQVYLEATEDADISVESFRNSPQIQSYSTTTATTTMISFTSVPVGNYNYFRISWQYPDVWQYGSQQNASLYYGSVTKVVAQG